MKTFANGIDKSNDTPYKVKEALFFDSGKHPLIHRMINTNALIRAYFDGYISLEQLEEKGIKFVLPI